MHDLLPRAAAFALALAGLIVAAVPADAAGAAMPLLQHRQFMVGMLAAGLVLAAFLPALRTPAIGAALLSEMSLLAIGWASGAPAQAAVHLVCIALLAFAATVFVREARRQARWDGAVPLRREA